MEIHQGFSFEHRFISMKNFTQGQRPKKPENIRSQIFVPKISERANNTIQKYFVFKHTYRQLPLSLKIWFEFWWWEDQNIRKLPNQSPSPRALPSVIANTMVRNRRNTAHCTAAAGEKWSNWNTNYDFLPRPPAPVPAPRWDRAAGWLFRCLSIIKWERSLMDNNSTSLGEQFI